MCCIPRQYAFFGRPYWKHPPTLPEFPPESEAERILLIQNDTKTTTAHQKTSMQVEETSTEINSTVKEVNSEKVNTLHETNNHEIFGSSNHAHKTQNTPKASLNPISNGHEPSASPLALVAPTQVAHTDPVPGSVRVTIGSE